MPVKNSASPSPHRKRARKTKKYIIETPLTAEQISKGVGVTKKDAALVDKVLRELGYIQDEKPAKGKATRTGKVKVRSLKS